MKKLLVLLVSTTLFFSCKKHKMNLETPKCINEKINEFKISETNDNANVKEYKFQGKIVYTLDHETSVCHTVQVINGDCGIVGVLGGKMGNTKINGEEFSNAIFIKTIWKK